MTALALSSINVLDLQQDGIFDVDWPTSPNEHESFSAAVAGKIGEKGFCVIRGGLTSKKASDAVEACKRLQWGILQGDIEEHYLGCDLVDGKVAWLSYQGQGISAGMRIYDLEELEPDMRLEAYDALGACDKSLTDVAALLWPMTPEFEDERSFLAWGRTTAMVRASMDGDEGIRTTVLPGAEDFDIHDSWMESKKLCMIYVLDADGGELELRPHPEAYDFIDAELPLVPGTIVVFRCDELGMNYCYRPHGRNLSIQAWVMDVPAQMKAREEALRIIDGPGEPQGRRNHVMATSTRYPGNGFEPLAFWNMLVTGGDTQIQVPIRRWDIDVYYRKEHTMGFSMTQHGATVTQSEIELFDNAFFGISTLEASQMAPYMRVCLEVGYDCLWRAGHKKEDMKGWKCGVFIGDSGSDWDSLNWPDKEHLPFVFSGRERSAACTRLSHVLGLTGPTQTSETACSSSLVACGVAQMCMRFQAEDQKMPHITCNLIHGVVIGSNSLVGPYSYISLSGPGMLTRRGRCFTFDHSADGFARGEGFGAIKLKVCENSAEAVDRVAMLIGCCVNQDGRSASMTAPHGPSQTDVIKASMREAGISPNLITIAECHGTGTALGDPIEVGALKAVLRSDRTTPILKTSAKSNIGHLEAAAGIAGLIKCICMLNYSCGAPNVHLNELNPHLDVQGYPVYFETELIDYGTNSGLTGVSSFGFGGTNARADVWGHSHHGHRTSITGIVAGQRSIVV